MRRLLSTAALATLVTVTVACTTSRDAGKPARRGVGDLVLTETTGVTFHEPALVAAELRQDDDRGAYLLLSVTDLAAASAPPTQFQLRIYGRPAPGSELSFTLACDGKNLQGACAVTVFDGLVRTSAGSVRIGRLPAAVGEPYDVTFRLSNGPELQVAGNAAGAATAPSPTVPLSP